VVWEVRGCETARFEFGQCAVAENPFKRVDPDSSQRIGPGRES
jgi:hypothetical protein